MRADTATTPNAAIKGALPAGAREKKSRTPRKSSPRRDLYSRLKPYDLGHKTRA